LSQLYVAQQHGHKPPTPLFFSSNGVSEFLSGGKNLTEAHVFPLFSPTGTALPIRDVAFKGLTVSLNQQ
jgi:hypothetical protein